MRFELLEGVEWCGNYSTRRGAMADAELRAAKRGQTVRWEKTDACNVTMGYPEPADAGAPFRIRPRRSIATRASPR